jgi:predicted RNA-binding protein YlqC (UPF0109 family)
LKRQGPAGYSPQFEFFPDRPPPELPPCPKRLRFKLVLRQSDVALLIGRNGFSASAIRGVMKSITEREDVNVSLQIHSTEEEIEMLARERH